MTGLAGDPGKDVLVDFCGLFQMREVTGALDHLHCGIRAKVAFGITDEIHADAAIGAAMQVKRRLRSTPGSRLRPRPAQRYLARGARDPCSAVIADRRRQTGRVSQGIPDLLHAIRRVETWRPVFP